jgi:hypothetical protein
MRFLYLMPSCAAKAARFAALPQPGAGDRISRTLLPQSDSLTDSLREAPKTFFDFSSW